MPIYSRDIGQAKEATNNAVRSGQSVVTFLSHRITFGDSARFLNKRISSGFALIGKGALDSEKQLSLMDAKLSGLRF